MTVLTIMMFVIGTFFGSFYCCIANRLSKNESIIKPGSHCENCNHRLTWYELIPVFSFVIQGGKCRKCKIKLSKEYLIAEIATGLLFALSFYFFQFSYKTISLLLLSSLLVTTIISDFKYMIILDEVLIPIAIGLIIIMFFEYDYIFVLKMILRGFTTFVLFLIIKMLGDKAFKQESLGWGDIKLSFVAGLMLGFRLSLVYMFLAALIALPYGLILRKIKEEPLMPFGPFLTMSLCIIYVLSPIFNNLMDLLIIGG
jgi:leader peptidase (prepilin peptidase)/N-methyltransferase